MMPIRLTPHKSPYGWIFLFLCISWSIVAFGQPAWCSQLGPVAAACGFALLWLGLRKVKKGRFWLSATWYCCVQLVQLSWLTSIEYQGYYIIGVYLVLCICLGMQFGVLTRFLLAKPRPDKGRVLAAAALWTLIEWSRLFILCGFSLNPVGMAMTSVLYSLQLANVVGIFGLTFWVILVNATVYRSLCSPRSYRAWGICIALAALPYIYGWITLHRGGTELSERSSRSLTVGLVQTGLLPSQKVPLPGRNGEFIPPLEQWNRILASLQQGKKKWDLLIFPEAVVPLRADFCVYLYEEAMQRLRRWYGSDVTGQLPPLTPPFAQERVLQGMPVLCVSNAFFAQALANIYGTDVVIGLDHFDPINRCNYNSAFHFAPHSQKVQRYDKQILLPLAEYLPFSWLKSLTKYYGITEFFSHGNETQVFTGQIPFSLSICYEETFPHLIRQGRLKGAELLINVTNDNYYPFSRLPEQHFSHALIRAVENGAPLLRSCNTGVTAVVDRFGRTLSRLGKDREYETEVLTLSFSHECHPTVYMWWGDQGIISLAAMLLLLFFLPKNLFRRRSSPVFQLEENRSVS